MQDQISGTPHNLDKLDGEAERIRLERLTSEINNEKVYKERMVRRKEIQEKRLKGRISQKGLIIVFTGKGKGKTTAAIGMALRTIGHGDKVAIIQFIKGGWVPGESLAFKNWGSNVAWHAFGEGFTWETQDRVRDKELVTNAWLKSLDYLSNEEYKLVILDEINIAIKLDYISWEIVYKGIKSRPPLTHVVLTGRDAKEELIASADLVTEMNLIHHPFKEQGVKAQKGIEF
tara:strand:+ start:3338 stop:4030 length:693 start_codon:yes stop_codon:yes gene_type:complete